MHQARWWGILVLCLVFGSLMNLTRAFPSIFTPSPTNICPSTITKTSKLCMSSSSSSTALLDSISDAVSKALNRPVVLERISGGGYAGGGGAATSAVVEKGTDTKYFVKSASGEADMLRAEYLGIKAMSDTNTIRVPKPIAFGESGHVAFVVFEYLAFTGGGSEYELGVQLANMHKCTSGDKGFGFDVDNTIGATPQPNLPWMNDWADFWDTHRLGHMLKLTNNEGFDQATIDRLRKKTRQLLSHKPAPSLLHGDLWGGNKGYAKEEDGSVVPVIFDPATYYGDREADVAMTYVFGGFGSDFYSGYESVWPLPEGHEKRRTIYNLYHILNHDVLFGGMYGNQARGMIDKILAF